MLITHDVISPTKHLTYENIETALPALLLACEMPLFAILIFLAFPVAPYKAQTTKAGPFQAIIDALNWSDIFSAFIRGPMRLVRGQHRDMIRQDSLRLMGPPPDYDNSMEYGAQRV